MSVQEPPGQQPVKNMDSQTQNHSASIDLLNQNLVRCVGGVWDTGICVLPLTVILKWRKSEE